MELIGILVLVGVVFLAFTVGALLLRVVFWVVAIAVAIWLLSAIF